MKLSLSWIFEHIAGTWRNYNIPDLVNKFNTTTAEIEQTKFVELDLGHFFIIRLIEIKKDSIIGFCPELNKEFTLPMRSDVKPDDLVLMKSYKNYVNWATLIDFWSEKEGLMPPLRMAPSLIAGDWKDNCLSEDYIFQIENKSITNRPDLWSHRGIAREIAAILNIPLKDEKLFLEKYPIAAHELLAPATPENPFTFEIADPNSCKRFAALYFKECNYQPSDLNIAHRLASVDTRPLNLIVDFTNYIMLDIGQPLHAFDAATIQTKKIIAKKAKQNEKISLLDGQTVELSDEDIIISDGKNALSVAGVMGGTATAITPKTQSIVLEAACFDATTIRRTALRLKKRTEASARFEKSLDPNLPIIALKRFLQLCKQYAVAITVSPAIISLGKEAQPIVITIDHTFIERRLGIKLQPLFIEKILQSLEFTVVKREINSAIQYEITVPTFRSSKDVTCKEDIVEEVGRFFGYNNIPLLLPEKILQPYDLQWLHTFRTIKTVSATALRAHEVYNYSLYDEEFLQKLNWQPSNTVTIQNPVSENWQKLVTSLVPHLLKNILQNSERRQALRFFECNHAWNLTTKNTVQERTMFAGIAYQPKEPVNFYFYKDLLNQLFSIIHLEVSWKKAEYIPFEWMHPYQTAFVMHDDVLIGYAGNSNPEFLNRVAAGDAFIFEFDADAMLQYADQEKKFHSLGKFPSTWQDVSMFVPLSVTVDTIINTIKKIDKRIFDVQLFDFFEKEEWTDKKSITIRWFARDPEKTLSKEDIDDIHEHIVIALQKSLQATIR